MRGMLASSAVTPADFDVIFKHQMKDGLPGSVGYNRAEYSVPMSELADRYSRLLVGGSLDRAPCILPLQPGLVAGLGYNSVKAAHCLAALQKFFHGRGGVSMAVKQATLSLLATDIGVHSFVR